MSDVVLTAERHLLAGWSMSGDRVIITLWDKTIGWGDINLSIEEAEKLVNAIVGMVKDKGEK